MRISAILIGAAFLLCWATLGRGAPLDPKERVTQPMVDGFGQREYWSKFSGGKRMLAIVVGSNRTNLGLYIFDAYGNCVARDDNMSSRSRDDLAVEWLPAHTGPFSIQVKSLAGVSNRFWFIVRPE